jgi:hypothetical protein
LLFSKSTITRSLSKVLVGSWEIDGIQISDKALALSGFGITNHKKYLSLLKTRQSLYGSSDALTAEIQKILNFSPDTPSLTFFPYSLSATTPFSYLPNTEKYEETLFFFKENLSVKAPKSSQFIVSTKARDKSFFYKKDELLFALQNQDLHFQSLESFPLIHTKDSSFYIFVEDEILYLDSFSNEMQEKLKNIKTDYDLEVFIFKNIPPPLLSFLYEANERSFLSIKYTSAEAKMSSVLSLPKKKDLELGTVVFIHKREQIDKSLPPAKVALTREASICLSTGKIALQEESPLECVDEKIGFLEKCQFSIRESKTLIDCSFELSENGRDLSLCVSKKNLAQINIFLEKKKALLAKKRKGYKSVAGLSIKPPRKIVPPSS